MPNKVQILRSSVAGVRPTGKLPGEMYVNFADSVVGYIDTAGNPVDITSVPVTIGDTAPTAPKVGSLWFDSLGGQLYVSYDDGTSQQWVIAVNAMQDLSGYLKLTGGTLTGPLEGTVATLNGVGGLSVGTPGVTAATYINPVGAQYSIQFDVPPGVTSNIIAGTKGGVLRWMIELGDSAPEPGDSSGSNLRILGMADDGSVSQANVVLSIARFDGVITIPYGINTPLINGAPAVTAGMLKELRDRVEALEGAR